ncbi:MAG: hypothetical protein ACR2KK_23300 [Acidimicrobiales bacterium]
MAHEGLRQATIATGSVADARSGLSRMQEHAQQSQQMADRNSSAPPGSPPVPPKPRTGGIDFYQDRADLGGAESMGRSIQAQPIR